MINKEEILCYYCEKILETHPRCKRCEILLHEKNDKYICHCGKQHTLIGKKGYCMKCWQKTLPKIISANEILKDDAEEVEEEN